MLEARYITKRVKFVYVNNSIFFNVLTYCWIKTISKSNCSILCLASIWNEHLCQLLTRVMKDERVRSRSSKLIFSPFCCFFFFVLYYFSQQKKLIIDDELFSCFWQAHMKFPLDYPYSPPSIRFLTKVWHPNVYEVSISENLSVIYARS